MGLVNANSVGCQSGEPGVGGDGDDDGGGLSLRQQPYKPGCLHSLRFLSVYIINLK